MTESMAERMAKALCVWHAMIRKAKGYTGGHAKGCAYHLDQYEHECTCGLKSAKGE